MKKILALLGCVVLCLSLTACTEADKVNKNLTLEADNFNIYRRFVKLSNFTDKIQLECMGYMSIEPFSDRVWITIEVTSGGRKTGYYKRHSVSVDSTSSWVVEDLSDGTEVNKYDYTINYCPEMIFPFKSIKTVK